MAVSTTYNMTVTGDFELEGADQGNNSSDIVGEVEIVGMSDGGYAVGGTLASGGVFGGGVLDGDTGMFNAWQASDGTTNGTLARLSNGNVVYASIDLNDEFDVDDDQIVIRIVDDGANPVAGPIIATPQGVSDLAMTGLVGGGFAVFYASNGGIDDDIQGKFYTAAGTVAATVNLGTLNLEDRPKLATLDNGNVVVVWRTLDSDYQVMAAVFTPTGIEVVAPFVVASTPDHRLAPDVTAINGGFVIAYQDDVSGSDQEIAITAYANNGAFDFTRTLTSNTTDDLTPRIVTLSNGMLAAVSIDTSTGSGQMVVRLLSPDDGSILTSVSVGAPFNFSAPNLADLIEGRLALTGIRLGDAAGFFIQARRNSIGDNANDTIMGDDLIDQAHGNNGNDAISGMGADDILYGGDGDDILFGGLGEDYMNGGVGNDVFYVDSTGDQVVEAANQGYDSVYSEITYTLGANIEVGVLQGTANLNLTGNSGNNLLIGNDGANVIDGGSGGADQMEGGKGDDEYILNSTTDTVKELAGQGYDTVFCNNNFDATGQDIEKVVLLGSLHRNITGNALNNLLVGNEGNNVIDGGSGGADDMYGGHGNDTYILNSTSDRVFEYAGQGTDLVITNNTFSAVGQAIENVTLTGALSRNLMGNELNNILTGNIGNNVLNGGAGADTMIGGAGNDTYHVDSTGDVVTELAGEGTDTVLSTISYDLMGKNVENATLTGLLNRNLLGSDESNTLIGNAGANILAGRGGIDYLTGGGGADTFDYNAVSDSTFAAYDRIYDLEAADIIDLSGIDANANVAGNQAFVKVAAFSNTAGQMTLTYNSGGGFTVLAADVNGDGVADMRIVLYGDHTAHSNFVF